jgi:hypothetical protein
MTIREVSAVAGPVVLKKLLREKHWQTYRTFCRQYDKAARAVDVSLVGSYPSRAQLHRWQSGDVKGLPYAHHCQVLEAMFPGVTAAQMFSPAEDESATRPMAGPLTASVLLNSVIDGLEAPDSPHPSWGKGGLANGSNSPGLQASFPLSKRNQITYLFDVDLMV